jgi:signal transduction histidine kinase
MQEARPFLNSAADMDWLRRSHLLRNCVLAIGLALGALVGTSVGVQLSEGRLNGSVLPALLLVGAAWLIVAYLLSRRGRLRLAGMMIVGLVLVALALALSFLPGYTTALLPFASLPIALAALLLSRRAIYLVVLATVLILVGMPQVAPYLPPLSLSLDLPTAPSQNVSLAMAALALFFLALTLAPLRAEQARRSVQLRQAGQSMAGTQQALQSAELARDEALSALGRQQRSQEVLVQHISDGAIAVDGFGKVIRANAAARQLWDQAAAGLLVGQSFEQIQALLSGPTAATQMVDVVELPREVAGDAESYTHILVDRRERARLARLRGELLKLLADEMRNPLTSMVTALEMTLGQNLPDGADRVLVGARRSGQRLLDLVTTMLEINQIEQNPGVLRRSPTSLRPVLEAGIAQTTPLQHQGAVTVVVEYSGDGTILLDNERMQRAFVHLLEHALRQSPPYSTVQVRTERQNGALVVRISDQGPGLTPQQREALFEQPAAPEGRSGSSLGLAFSKLVIETHGGQVWVESTGSQGCTYAFTLPVEA